MDIKVFITTKDGLLNIASPHTGVIARQYDNNAHKLIFVRPDEYQDHDLVLVFNAGNKPAGSANLGTENEYSIPNSLTIESSLRLQVRLEDADEYLESANIIKWPIDSSLEAIGDSPNSLPNEFDRLYKNAFTSVDRIENTLYFFNSDDTEIDSVDLPNNSSGNGNFIDTISVGYGDHAEAFNGIESSPTMGAAGDYSHAEGYYTIAIGNTSHAEGTRTQATASNAHSEGQNSIASGISSHAEGISTVASGSSSHAEGDSTQADGRASHAEGRNTVAMGTCSHAEGYNVTAAAYQHVSGRFNKNLASPSTSARTGTLFAIGNGLSDTDRSNAIRIDSDGSIYICTGESINAETKLQDITDGFDAFYEIVNEKFKELDGLATYSYVDSEIENVRGLISESGAKTVNGKSPNGEGNIEIGPSDMTCDGIPTFTTAIPITEDDTVLIALAKLSRAATSSQYQAKAEKNGSLITITSNRSDIDWTQQYAVIFDAPSDFSPTDTYYINNVTVNIQDETGHSLVNAWTQGSPVALLVKGNTAYFPGSHIGSNPYSLTTRAVDVWHNGKIIYESIIEISSLPYDSSLPEANVEYPHGISNLGQIIECNAFAMTKTAADRLQRPLPWRDWADTDSSYVNYTIYDDAILIQTKGSSSYNWDDYSATFIIRYVEA